MSSDQTKFHLSVGDGATYSGCFLPDMLLVAAEGLVDVEQEDKVLGLLQMGLLQMGLLAGTLEQLRG